MKRIVIASRKAKRIESQAESNPESGDNNPTPQQSFVFRLKAFGATQSLLCKCDRFSIIQVAEKGNEAKNDEEYTYDTNTRYKVCQHVAAQEKAGNCVYCISLIRLFYRI